MNKPEHKRIYRELAGQFGLPLDVVEKICDSQFDFVRETMMEGSDQQVRLQYLGLFSVKPWRREGLQKKKALAAQLAKDRLAKKNGTE
tara:strand:- start:538 stop:801 length:264 start_codon:yes stop_codon:yes gene_type:complete